MLDSSGALVNFDKIVGRRFFVSFYNTFNSNLFAAIPSLHAGYPTTIALSLWWRLRGRAWLFVVYPLLAWFSAVYLNHHYVIDLVLGSLYTVVAWCVSQVCAGSLRVRSIRRLRNHLTTAFQVLFRPEAATTRRGHLTDCGLPGE